MADRTSAEIFATIFEWVADLPPPEQKKAAQFFWKLSYGYDFHPCQMDCNEALEELGLAKETDDGYVYKTLDGKSWGP